MDLGLTSTDSTGWRMAQRSPFPKLSQVRGTRQVQGTHMFFLIVTSMYTMSHQVLGIDYCMNSSSE